MPEAGPDDLHALRRENRRLRRAVEELSILNELATAVTASRDVQEIMQIVIRRSLRAIEAEQGVITLLDEQAAEPAKTFVRMTSSSDEHQPFRLHQSLVGWMHRHKQPLLLNDPLHDPRFRTAAWDSAIRSLLCTPLISRARLTGLLTVFNKKDSAGFTEDDKRLLSIIAAQSAQVIENARLHEEEKKLQRMQEELRLAYEIQTNLLPKQPPRIPGYDLAGISRPAETVGGDYFDFLPVDEHHVGLCVGDVSGKGLPAALLMANVQATLRGQTLSTTSAGACLARANHLLCASTRRGSFVTMFYAVLDHRTHTLRYANAGHNRPLLRRAGGAIEPLPTGGLVLGFKPDVEYVETTLSLEPGDLLLIFSDGITEAMNQAREAFDEDRLLALLHAHAHEPTPVLLAHILQAVQQHTSPLAQADDQTLLAVRRYA